MTRLGRAGKILLALLTVEIAVLGVTGVALYFVYTPLASGWQTAHRAAALAALLTSVVAAGAFLLPRANRRTGSAAALVAGLPLIVVVGRWTGFRLPWDQLALRAVTVGGRFRGMAAIFDDQVRFVIRGRAEYSVTYMATWLVIHALVLGPAAVALVVLAWRRAGRGGDVT